ncbi:MAG: biotin--[acetyl-CoA-carboxylase] ligase [Novosphingobium sp.]|nr:biotin--[acetyl-CoA-carboxylase] ligase [Novosphingobium sp.]
MIEFIRETGSTNADLAARLRAGAAVAEGDWLVADRQSAGRGRQGKAWADGAGNFMGSTVVHLRDGDPEPSSLALVTGLAVRHAVAARLPAGIVAQLKWPNDVMIAGAKLVGILLERIGGAIVIGIGVNLVAAPDLPDRRTVSLAELGASVDRDSFAVDLAAALAVDLDRWRMFGIAPIVERWQQAAHPLGTPLVAGEPGAEPLAGEFAGLAADGALQLRLPDGTTRIINAGEVRLAGTSG